MNYPENVLAIIRREAEKYPDDIDRAVEEAAQNIRALPEFAGLVALLVHGAVRDLVHDIRHRDNVQMRRENGFYGGPAKVRVGDSREVNRICGSCYSYFIAGVTLGVVLGKELGGIAESEQAIADGHAFNVRLCRALEKMVGPDQTVKDAVPEKKLRDLFRRLQRRAERDGVLATAGN